MLKKLSSIFIMFLFSFAQIMPILSSSSTTFNDRDEFIIHSCPGPFPDDTIELTTFPVDLDFLFCNDNASLQNMILNNIGNWSTVWPITPWNGHFHSGHSEGADKWYLYSYRVLPICVPHAGTLKHISYNYDKIINYNGPDLLDNTTLYIDIGNDFELKFAHIDILKYIVDEIRSTGTYTFEEGELIGNVYEESTFASFDFHLIYKDHNICPLKYFSESIQTEITTNYNMIYERAKIAGTYPESKICNNHTCEIENTVWGVWEYNTGPYDEEFNDPSIIDAFGAWTIFNRNFTNPETYSKRLFYPYANLSDDVIGILADSFPAEISSYKHVSQSIIYLVEGNHSNGIFELMSDFDNDWGTTNSSVFAKFLVEENNNGSSDDVLTLEFFVDLLSAQAGFTNDKLTLTRYYHYYEDVIPSYQGLSDLAIYSIIASIIVVVLTLIILIPILIIRKRKKKN